MIVLKKNINAISLNYKKKFIREIYRENYYRTILFSIFCICGETLIYLFLPDKIFNTGFIVLYFIIFNIFLLPFLWLCYKKYNTINIWLLRSILFIYLSVILIYGCALSLYPQSHIITINTYIMALFAIAAFITIPPFIYFFLFITVYAGFFIALPYYQTNTEVVAILRINSLFMNGLAWFLSRITFSMKLASFRDRQIIEDQNIVLKQLATRDSMTLLLNHENMLQRLAEEIGRLKRIAYPLSIIMLDIDHFKSINDKYGHLAGDKVIIKVAQILRETCRSTDIIGRYGGEEFLIISPDTDSVNAFILAERIRNTIQYSEFPDGINVTISGGICNNTGGSAEEMIQTADRKLYTAKSEGRNRNEY